MRWIIGCVMLITAQLVFADSDTSTWCNDFGLGGFHCSSQTTQRPPPTRDATGVLLDWVNERKAQRAAQPTVIYVPVQPPPSPAPPNDGRLLLDPGFFRFDPIGQHRLLVQQGAKVCPTCILLYSSTMRYCPHDGAALKSVADYQEGALGQITMRQ